MKERTVGILSLGCPRNLVDSESILGRLSGKGYRITDLDKADIAIVNTCSFIEEAKKESIDAILELIDLKKRGKLSKIIVYGCLSQRYRDALSKELPEIDAFVGKVSLNHENSRFALTPEYYAYLKICEGCINSCSYCIIPRIKGKFASLDADSIINKAKSLDKQGIKELNIIGQDITGYGVDLFNEPKLAELIKKIIPVTQNIPWIRLLYLNPERLNDQLIKLIACQPRICKYVDLPIQHINGRILKLMNRRVKPEDVIRLIARIRDRIPQVALRTSVIVGFPGEKDSEFKELLEFIKETKFERLGAFIYSREEGTRAYAFKDQVPKKIKNERFGAIMSAQQEISRQVNNKFLGRTLDVLIEERQDGIYLGRTQYDAPEVDGQVFVRSRSNLKTGSIIKVKISDTLEYDLTGEAL